jgi:hypothetical protein
MSSVYVYAWRNKKNGMMNIGYKSPYGQDMATYITSLKSTQYWDEYFLGDLEQSFLFKGDIFDQGLAQTIEWFALDYGISTKPDKFYLKKNNAHRGDESLLTKEIKQIVIDYIEGGPGIIIENTAQEDNEIIASIAESVENRKFQIHDVDIKEVYSYGRSQVRTNQYDLSHVTKIRQGMQENPAEARKTFGPITVVVKADGSRMIMDGNSRLEAASKIQGWNTVPIVLLNESEFGVDDRIRSTNYTIYGLYMNRESFEVKLPNSNDDIKNSIINYIVNYNLDLSKPLVREKVRDEIYDRFLIVARSKKQLNGIFTSILNDFDKQQAELKYQKNLITYDEAFFKRYLWHKYGVHDIATVHTSQKTAKHAEVLGWILRRMKNVKAAKGAIVLYYANKSEIVNEESEKWIEDLKETIAYQNLPVTVEVLPIFVDE